MFASLGGQSPYVNGEKIGFISSQVAMTDYAFGQSVRLSFLSVLENSRCFVGVLWYFSRVYLGKGVHLEPLFEACFDRKRPYFGWFEPLKRGQHGCFSCFYFSIVFFFFSLVLFSFVPFYKVLEFETFPRG